jgi:hypothetical protein
LAPSTSMHANFHMDSDSWFKPLVGHLNHSLVATRF